MQSSFRAILKQLRIKALTELIAILVPDLEAEGFTFPDLLLALADWSESQAKWQSAAYYLEQAASLPQSQPQHELPSEQPKAE
jgi:hypothetical protein